MDQQYDDGLIAYRHGPRGPQVYPHEGEPTTSAPVLFLDELGDLPGRQGQASSCAMPTWPERNTSAGWSRQATRTTTACLNGDRTASSRTSATAGMSCSSSFPTGKTKAGIFPAELDALDLTLEVANEMYYLRQMAAELGDRCRREGVAGEIRHAPRGSSISTCGTPAPGSTTMCRWTTVHSSLKGKA